jgi:hypothetical protein
VVIDHLSALAPAASYAECGFFHLLKILLHGRDAEPQRKVGTTDKHRWTQIEHHTRIRGL